MAKNRSEFLTYVKLDFKRDDKDTEIIQAYNDTIKHLGNLEGVEGLKFQSWIYTVADQEDYPLPSRNCHIFHPIRCIKGISDSSGYPMNKMSKEDFSERYPNPNAADTSSIPKSQPVDYTIYSNQLSVGPLPDLATYILEIDWAKIPTSQDADSDTQELGEEWEEVIKWGTLARLYEGMGLTAEADRFWTLYTQDDLGYPALIKKYQDKEESMGKVEYRDF